MWESLQILDLKTFLHKYTILGLRIFNQLSVLVRCDGDSLYELVLGLKRTRYDINTQELWGMWILSELHSALTENINSVFSYFPHIAKKILTLLWVYALHFVETSRHALCFSSQKTDWAFAFWPHSNLSILISISLNFSKSKGIGALRLSHRAWNWGQPKDIHPVTSPQDQRTKRELKD